MLKIRYLNLTKDPFWIMERSYTIGTADDNHLCIEHPTVSAHHARVVRDLDSIIIKDLGSESGTYVNGQRVNSRPITCGDRLRIGDIELEIVDPVAETQSGAIPYWSLIGDSSWLAGQEFPLRFNEDNSLVLGRGKSCDLVFPGTHLSREHARITRHKDKLLLQDLKSANATFVNDRKVDQAELYPGDQIRLDVYSFRVFGPGIKLHKAATRQFEAITDEQIENELARRAASASSAEKRWKTRPTSPGNREEPVSKKTPVSSWLVALFLLTALAALTLKFFGGY